MHTVLFIAHAHHVCFVNLKLPTNPLYIFGIIISFGINERYGCTSTKSNLDSKHAKQNRMTLSWGTTPHHTPIYVAVMSA